LRDLRCETFVVLPYINLRPPPPRPPPSFQQLYFQGDVNDGLNKYGLFLNCVMQLLFANISEMSGAVEGKFIGYRQVANSVHPSWAFPLASILAHIPVAIVESLCFGGIAYFMCGMTYDAGRFFFFTLTIFLIDVYAATLFRLFAFSAPNLVSAQAGPMPIIALLIMFSGFMVARSKMGWLEFIFWLNPAGWAIQSLAQNEFYAPRYSFFPSFGTVTSTSTLGKSYLSLMDMQLDTSYQWYGILFIVAMTVVVASAQFAAFAFIRYDRNTGSARVSEDAPKDSVRVVLRADSSSNVLPQSASSGNIVVRDPSIGSIPSAASARSVLPFTPLALAWKDLSYTVKLSKQAGGGERTLLHGVTGYALPGRLIALMGASGAGKTTLLDVLSGRKNTGKQTGQIFLNGFLKDKRTFNRSASYCEQNDLHMPLTTVREAIAFSAELRLPSTVRRSLRAAHATCVNRRN
jgi:ABC-type multidrug transport system fused ATPase/permease subunit